MATSIGKSTYLKIPAATGEDPSYNLLQVDSIGDLSLSRDEIEDTVYGSEDVKTFIAGLRDYGTFDVVLNYDSTDTSHNFLIERWNDGASESYQIEFPDSSTFDFTAFISGVGMAQPKDEKIQRTFTMKIDGKTTPTFSEVTV